MLQNYSFPSSHQSDYADAQDIANHRSGKHRDWLLIATHILTRSRVDIREAKPLERLTNASH